MSTQPGATDEQPAGEQSLAGAQPLAQLEGDPKEEEPTTSVSRPLRKALQAPSSQDLQRLHHQLGYRYKEVAMTRMRQLMIEECVQELQAVVSALFQNCTVRSFGSIQNGFSTEDSDLDATIAQDAVMQMDAHMAAEILQRCVLPALAENKNFEISGTVAAARIPILKLRYWRGQGEALDVDLSCHNTEPLPNTQLLSAYAHMDPIIVALGVLVKLWAKSAGVSGATRKHLSSYSIILMVLYFLQVEHGMPCLPTWAFNGSREIPPQGQRQWKWNDSMSLLLFEFFKFYATEFKWGTEVVAMHIGERTANSDDRHNDLRGRWTTQLHIEDPILTNRNLNAPLGLEQEQQLRAAIWEAACALEQGNLPVGLTPVNRSGMGGGFGLQGGGGYGLPTGNMGMQPPMSMRDRWAYGMPQPKPPMMSHMGGLGSLCMGMQDSDAFGKGKAKMCGGKGLGGCGLKGAMAKFGMQGVHDGHVPMAGGPWPGGPPGGPPPRVPKPKLREPSPIGQGSVLAKAKSGKAKAEPKEKAKTKSEPKTVPVVAKQPNPASSATHHVVWSRKLPPTDGRVRAEDRDMRGDACPEGPPEDEVPMPFLSQITWLV